MLRQTYSYILSVSLIISFSCSRAEKEKENEDEHHGHNEIMLSSAQAVEFGIEHETVTPKEFYDVIKTSGQVETSPSDIYKVTAKKSGIITVAPGIITGSHIKAGERIASVSSEGLQGGDATEAAQANLNAARQEYERLKPLFEDGLVTASTFREAERNYNEAKALMGKGVSKGVSVLTSPIDGIVNDLYVGSGEYVEVGSPVATLTKNVGMVLKADLPAREAKHFGELETANFIPEGSDRIFKLQELNGKKTSGNTLSQANNGYIPVYFSFTADPVSITGGYAEVYLICGKRNDVISVPRDALVEIQGNKYAYVLEEGHGYEKRIVETGASDGERVEIKSGLNEGDQVVSKGASIIRMVEVSSIAPPGHNHSH